jgi:hypothetical protein
MDDASRRFMMELRSKLWDCYDAQELQTLCFDLGIDYDDLRGGAKQTKINSLINTLARNGRLPELVAYARRDRTHLIWPDVPDGFELPQPNGSDSGEGAVYYVQTGGGAFVKGDVNTGGGSFSGRDLQVGGDQTGGTTMTMSGDFRGAVLNVQSRLDNVTQTIADSSHGRPDDRLQLVRLVNELRHELARVPPEQVADADAIARRVEVLTDEVRNETPDHELVDKIGESLKNAATRLAPRLPRILTLVSAIVEVVKILVRS